jgi:hypothetical protein
MKLLGFGAIFHRTDQKTYKKSHLEAYNRYVTALAKKHGIPAPSPMATSLEVLIAQLNVAHFSKEGGSLLLSRVLIPAIASVGPVKQQINTLLFDKLTKYMEQLEPLGRQHVAVLQARIDINIAQTQQLQRIKALQNEIKQLTQEPQQKLLLIKTQSLQGRVDRLEETLKTQQSLSKELESKITELDNQCNFCHNIMDRLEIARPIKMPRSEDEKAATATTPLLGK